MNPILDNNSIKIYNCDNLELLNKLKDNSIDLIYCDLLYGTNRNFGVYKDIGDSFQEVKKHYLPRLREMFRVLSEKGNIILQMDWRIDYYIRILMDFVFGKQNFRNQIIWSYNSAPRKKGCFGFRHDVLLRYTKTDDFYFNEIRVPYSETAPRGYAKEKYYNEKGKVIGDVWQIPILGQNDKTERTGYPTQKPLNLLNLIIKSLSKENDLVADFYMGSGTCAISALQNNRKFIGCDLSLDACKICLERLNKLY